MRVHSFQVSEREIFAANRNYCCCEEKNVNLPPKTTILIKSHCFLYSDRLVRLWRVTGTLDEQLGELERAVDD